MEYTLEEVCQCTTRSSSWIIINGKVLDVTEWMFFHPGGIKAIERVVGTDCTELFMAMHRPEIYKMLPIFTIGVVKDWKQTEIQQQYHTLLNESNLMTN